MIAGTCHQPVSGMRIQAFAFLNRTLFHVEYHSLTPAAKGLVTNSFYMSVMTATEDFSFHTQGSCERLVHTAVNAQ